MKTQEVQNHDHLKKVFNYNQVFVKYVMYINIKVRERVREREGTRNYQLLSQKLKLFQFGAMIVEGI